MFKFTLAITSLLISVPLSAAVPGYSQPPKEILDVMNAPSTPYPIISPTTDRMILVSMEEYPSIERVAEPFLRLAGVRIEPRNHSKHDTNGGYGIPSCATGYSILKTSDGTEKKIDISKIACADYPQWSADGKNFFFQNRGKTSVELWIGDAQTGRISKVPNVKLNPMFGSEAQWMPDQKSLLIKMIPKNIGAMPVIADELTGPAIQEASGEKGQSSTYEKRDTLNNANDEKVFDYFGTSQLALVDIKTKAVTLVDSPALFDRISVSPDGKQILASKIVRPYSYIVTYSRFPKKFEALNITNPKKVTRQLIADLPLADRVPVHGVPMGPRQFQWHIHEPATLIWAEALDGGDWEVKVPNRDKVMTLASPFTGTPKELFKTEQRYSGLAWSEKRTVALFYEFDENKHWIKTFIVNTDDPAQGKKVLWDLSYDDQYGDPGNPVYKTLANGRSVIRQNQNYIYLDGKGASPDGNRPFLDRLDLNTLKTERLFRSSKAELEDFSAFLGDDTNTYLTWFQTQQDVPNLYKRTLGVGIKAPPGDAVFTSSDRIAVTHMQDPTPQVRQIKKCLVKYKRADGVDLSFTLYTPPGYKEGTRVPTILNAYPLDYAEASKAGQTTGSENSFTRLRSYKLLLLAGYAVIDRASFPVVGDPKKAYDSYMEQLLADANAAVKEAVKLGVADPDRIGVTGHSHGALMTANLVTHSTLFKAGVATSGSYNKTLTPFGFQSERRSVWDAPTVYQNVSPFFFANKIKAPLLIIHGADDANPGTTPMQASFLYEAIRGNGGTTRLVMLPHEPHWYTARESNEQEVYEMLNWFDKHVKNAPKK